MSAASATGRRSTEPAAARTALGPKGSVLVPAKTTPAAPAASAARTRVPALPGSATSTSTRIGPVRVGSATSSARSTGRRGATASRPWGVTVSATLASDPRAERPDRAPGGRGGLHGLAERAAGLGGGPGLAVDEDLVDRGPGGQRLGHGHRALDHERTGVQTRPTAPREAP